MSERYQYKGIRKVNEDILQDGRRLILTEEAAEHIDQKRVKDGTLKISRSEEGKVQYKEGNVWSNLPYINAKIDFDKEGNRITTFYNKDSTPIYRIRESAEPRYMINFGIEKGEGNIYALHEGTPINNQEMLAQGEKITLQAEPGDRYIIGYWSVNGQNIYTTQSEYIIHSLNRDTSIFVAFEDAKQIIITFESGPHGDVQAFKSGAPINNGHEDYEGETIRFQASPQRGYQVKEWVVNGTKVQGNTSEFLNIELEDEDINVFVEFEQRELLDEVPIGIPGFHPDTHILMVFQNGTYIRENEEYYYNGEFTGIRKIDPDGFGWEMDTTFKIYALTRDKLVLLTDERLIIEEEKSEKQFAELEGYQPETHTSLLFQNSILKTYSYDYLIEDSKLSLVDTERAWNEETVLDILIASFPDYTVNSLVTELDEGKYESGIFIENYDSEKDKIIVFINGIHSVAGKSFLIHNNQIVGVNHQEWAEGTEIKVLLFRPEGASNNLLRKSIYN